MWWSVTLHVGTLPIGILGAEVFELSLKQSVAAIIVGTILGSLCTAATGTLGPKVSSIYPESLLLYEVILTPISWVYVQSQLRATLLVFGVQRSALSST